MNFGLELYVSLVHHFDSRIRIISFRVLKGWSVWWYVDLIPYQSTTTVVMCCFDRCLHIDCLGCSASTVHLFCFFDRFVSRIDRFRPTSIHLSDPCSSRLVSSSIDPSDLPVIEVFPLRTTSSPRLHYVLSEHYHRSTDRPAASSLNYCTT